MVTEAQRAGRKRRRAAKKARAATASTVKRSPRQRRSKRPTRSSRVPLARASTSKNNGSSESITLSGIDFLPKVRAAANSSGIVYTKSFDPEVFPRLEKLASTFQRITWDSIEIDNSSYFPTSTGGGYVTAFVQDAAQSYPEGEDAIPALFANEGAQASKWWNDTQVRMLNRSDKLYTTEAETPRFSSPGMLVIASDGAPSQDGYLRPCVKWRVTLSEPTLDHVPNVLLLKVPLWARKGSDHTYYSPDDGTTWVADVGRNWFGIDPLELLGTKWTIDPPYTQYGQTGATDNTVHSWAYMSFEKTATAPITMRGYTFKNNAEILEEMGHNVTCFMPGSKFRRFYLDAWKN